MCTCSVRVSILHGHGGGYEHGHEHEHHHDHENEHEREDEDGHENADEHVPMLVHVHMHAHEGLIGSDQIGSDLIYPILYHLLSRPASLLSPPVKSYLIALRQCNETRSDLLRPI